METPKSNLQKKSALLITELQRSGKILVSTSDSDSARQQFSSKSGIVKVVLAAASSSGRNFFNFELVSHTSSPWGFAGHMRVREWAEKFLSSSSKLLPSSCTECDIATERRRPAVAFSCSGWLPNLWGYKFNMLYKVAVKQQRAAARLEYTCLIIISHL